MINISSLATFLSINAEDIKEITPVKSNGDDYIYIVLKRKEALCPDCSSRKTELKETDSCCEDLEGEGNR